MERQTRAHVRGDPLRSALLLLQLSSAPLRFSVDAEAGAALRVEESASQIGAGSNPRRRRERKQSADERNLRR